MRPKQLNQGQLWGAAATGIRVARCPSGSPTLIVTAEMEQQAKWKRQVERAQAMVSQGPQDSTPQRGHISVEIRNYVFQRDGGQCVTCGSTVEFR